MTRYVLLGLLFSSLLVAQKHSISELPGAKKDPECGSTVAIKVGFVADTSATDDIKAAAANILGNAQHFAIVGTGFVVSQDGYVVTANHVVVAAQQRITTLNLLKFVKGSGGIFFAAPRVESGPIQFTGTTIGYDYDIVGQDAINDLALLKMHAPPKVKVEELLKENLVTPAKISQANAEPGTNVSTCGFPFAIPEAALTSGKIASYTLSAKDALVNSIPGETKVQLVDLRISGGNRGGAIISQNRTVVGVVDAYVSAPQFAGIAVMIPASAVRELLVKYGANAQ